MLNQNADGIQERELEKVNVFYLQKEAEVSRMTWLLIASGPL